MERKKFVMYQVQNEEVDGVEEEKNPVFLRLHSLILMGQQYYYSYSYELRM